MIEVAYIANNKFIITVANKIVINSDNVLVWSFSNTIIKIEHIDIMSIIGASGNKYILDDIKIQEKMK